MELQDSELLGKFISAIVKTDVVNPRQFKPTQKLRHQSVHGIVEEVKGVNGSSIVVLRLTQNAQIPNGSTIEVPISQCVLNARGNKIATMKRPPMDMMSNEVTSLPFSR